MTAVRRLTPRPIRLTPRPIRRTPRPVRDRQPACTDEHDRDDPVRAAATFLNPKVFGLRISILMGLYRRRLRHHLVREILAGGGIAVGVALVFGVLVANGSVLSSAREIIHGVDGAASYELAARSPQGFSEALGRRVEHLRYVRAAAMLLREDAVIVGPRGKQLSVQLVGITPELRGLHGTVTRNVGTGAIILSGGVALPSDVSAAIGVQPEEDVTLLSGGSAHTTQVRVVLAPGEIGGLASSSLAIASLDVAQSLTSERGRITEVLIRTAPGKERLVAGELAHVAAGKLDVVPADAELGLLDQTAKPTNQSSELFAAIGLMVGFLLALNAMLLVVPERRREIAEMRCMGFDSKQVLAIFAFQATVLGLGASLVGVAFGDLLARTLFANDPIYLSVAFPISGQQTIGIGPVVVSLLAGLAATTIASITPILLDLFSAKPVDAVLSKRGEAGQQISSHTTRLLAIVGLLIVLGVTAAVHLSPTTTVVGGVALALAALCFIPLVFELAIRLLRLFVTRVHGGMMAIATIELESGAVRAIALAGVAALAVYGSAAVEGARHDLARGLDQSFAEYIGGADIWVTPKGNNLTVNSFSSDGSIQTVAHASGVASVMAAQGEYLDVGSRRMWVIARAPDSRAMLPADQLVEGQVALATRRLRAGGWAAVSSSFAEEHDLHVGDAFTLPTPSGSARFRVAALTTNIGWPPGTITINTDDYSHYWLTTEPAALEVSLKPGVPIAQGKREVERALRGRQGLSVQTMDERIGQFRKNAGQGLHSLAEIALLLLLTAALALAAALSTVIYQRRAQFAALRQDGFDRRQLWRGLLAESAVLLAIGCIDGAALGIYGHDLANRYLRLDTGFPAPFSLGLVQLLLILLLIGGVACAVIALPGYTAVGVPVNQANVEN